MGKKSYFVYLFCIKVALHYTQRCSYKKDVFPFLTKQDVGTVRRSLNASPNFFSFCCSISLYNEKVEATLKICSSNEKLTVGFSSVGVFKVFFLQNVQNTKHKNTSWIIGNFIKKANSFLKKIYRNCDCQTLVKSFSICFMVMQVRITLLPRNSVPWIS